jgi:hypothetical protein
MHAGLSVWRLQLQPPRPSPRFRRITPSQGVTLARRPMPPPFLAPCMTSTWPLGARRRYKAHFRWPHARVVHDPAGSLITDTDACPSVTSCFLQASSMHARAPHMHKGCRHAQAQRTFEQRMPRSCKCTGAAGPCKRRGAAHGWGKQEHPADPLHQHAPDQGCRALLGHAPVSQNH